MHLLDVFPLFFTLSSLSLSPWSPTTQSWQKHWHNDPRNFSDRLHSLICGEFVWVCACVVVRTSVLQWKERRKKGNGRVRWLIKKTDLPADSSGLFYCNNLMTRPTHVLPNSIRNSPTTLHSRGNGSVATTFLLLWAPVWRQGQEAGKEGNVWREARISWSWERWVGGESCIVFDMHEVETSVGARLAWSMHAWSCTLKETEKSWLQETGGHAERSWMSTREGWKWISRRGDLHSVVERKPLRCPE